VTPTEIESAVLDAFQYLMTDFGFSYQSTSMHAPECWSTFWNTTTAVTIHYELGSLPWVELAELVRDSSRVIERNRTSLEFLLTERAPEEAGIPAGRSDEVDVKHVIYEKARLLRQYGQDVLGGDFRIFPRLKELAAENLQRREEAER